ncbi:MAG: glycoside hydrolase family 11 protein, partial [Bacteroidales bacterium]|nr:glycoside hydrolase family 11 protein [Bacteroidales bacterium]
WTKVPNEVEYYIVENTFFGSTAKQQGLYYGANKVGSYTIADEGTYDLYIGTRTNAPSISGTSTFKQVFAVRTTPRKCGHISISEHMRKWAQHVTLGALYDCKFLCEVGSGSGSFDMKYGNVWIGDKTSGGGSTEPAQPTEKEEPYKGAIAVPGTLQCEDYDKGGNGFGYSDTDSKNEGEQYRKDGVDIVKANDGYAVGYTDTDEWLKYTINVEADGTYNVGAYMANGNADPKITLYVDGKKATSLTGKGASDWDTYSMAKGTISLSKGEHTLKLNFDNAYTNIDYLVFSKDAIENPSTGGSTGGTTGGETGGTTGGETTGVNPCGTFSSMTSGQKAQNGGTHNIAGGFNYEMWTNSGNNASMEYYAEKGKFQFKANWNNPDDLLCRIGLYWGTGPKPSELEKDLQCDFNYDFTGTGGGYNYIGIYGWTKVPNEVEYYIVENTFFGSTAKQQGLYYGANKVGSYTIADEGTYDLYIGTRTNAPSISGTSTFKQVFAVRTTPRKCGHISISEHMRKWASNVTLGALYDCKFLCEVGSGSGSFDMKYGNVWMGDKVYSNAPAKPTETEEPFKGVIAIPGTLECENYDKGGNGFGYYDTDDTNEGKEYRKDGVDIVAANDGYAVGYTATDEWLKFTVDVAADGEYNVGAYMANGSTDPKITILVDGKKGCSLTGKGVSEDWDT